MKQNLSRGRLVLWFIIIITTILLLTRTAHRQSLRLPEERVQHPPLFQSAISDSSKSRLPPRYKQTSFELDSTDGGISYFENYFLDSFASSLEAFDDFTDYDGPGLNHTWPDFSVNKTTNLFRHGCYIRGEIKGFKELLPHDKLKELGCKRRPPEAIVFGVKKGGTTTLKEFLAFHPGVSVAPKELKFLSSAKLRKQGLDGYASFMPYSLPDQIPIEKTPGYMVRYRCIEPLKEMIPDCKLIAILSDPVRRAVSDFVHLSYVRDNRKGGAGELLPKHANKTPHYEVRETFEESVLYPNGSIKTWNTLLDTSLYYKHAKVWLEHFPPENFLFMDSNDLVYNPAKSLQEIEDFLGLPRFFSDFVFHFNETKGFYCIQYPIYSCMPAAKGRIHPVVDDAVIRKLQEYFEPYNKQFSELVGRNFSWTTYAERQMTEHDL